MYKINPYNKEEVIKKTRAELEEIEKSIIENVGELKLKNFPSKYDSLVEVWKM